MNRILCVDDDQSFQRALRAMLRDTARLESSYSIQDAFLALKKQPFDLIVLDHCLPDGNGFEFIEKLPMPMKNIPIVVLTGYPSQEIHEKYSSWNQVHHFLTKPLYPDTLEATLRDLFPPVEETGKTEYHNSEEERIHTVYVNTVKNNLTVLRGIIEIFSIQFKTYSNNELASKGIECIETLNRMFDELIQEYKSLCSNSQPKQEDDKASFPIALDTLLRSLMDSLRPEMEKHSIHLQLSIPDELKNVQVHSGMLKEALHFLIKNSCSRLQNINEACLNITVSQKGPYCCVHLNDNGPCITGAYFANRRSIFNTTVKESQSHSSILHSIQAMGWDLETKSSNGYGNLITLKAPIFCQM